MTTNDLHLGALGFAVLAILVAFMLQAGTLTSVTAAATILPAALVMFVQVVRHRRALAA